MKRIIGILTVAALLSGCGIFNKVFKHKTSEKILEESSKELKAKTDLNIIDKSVITITETLDTPIITAEVKGRSEKKVNLVDVQKGLTVIDDQFVTLHQIYNPLDSTLRTDYVLKPRSVAAPFKRVTEKHNNIASSVKQEQDQKEERKKRIEKSDAVVERKPGYTTALVIIGVIVLLLFLVRKLWKSK
jgi:hypothetical protein